MVHESDNCEYPAASYDKFVLSRRWKRRSLSSAGESAEVGRFEGNMAKHRYGKIVRNGFNLVTLSSTWTLKLSKRLHAYLYPPRSSHIPADHKCILLSGYCMALLPQATLDKDALADKKERECQER